MSTVHKSYKINIIIAFVFQRWLRLWKSRYNTVLLYFTDYNTCLQIKFAWVDLLLTFDLILHLRQEAIKVKNCVEK